MQELHPFGIGDPEFDQGVLMPWTQRYRLSIWLLRIATGDGREHPHLEEMIAKLHRQVVYYDGPGNRSGAVLTAEVKAKMAKAKLGKKRKPFSEETKRRMSAAKSGVNNPGYGRKRSQEARELMSKLSYDREARRRAAKQPGNIIPIPPPEFTRGQMGKANRALRRLGVLLPTEEAKTEFLRFLRSIEVDPMQASSRVLARIYAERSQKDA
jgi:hypothetical protein